MNTYTQNQGAMIELTLGLNPITMDYEHIVNNSMKSYIDNSYMSLQKPYLTLKEYQGDSFK